MRRIVICILVVLNVSAMLAAQRGADPTQRYFRLICLVHLKGSGKSGDPIVPEYVAEGMATAQAAIASNLQHGQDAQKGLLQAAPLPALTPSRPGFIAWSMLTTDNGKMAIIQVVAADHHAFDELLADKRSEIRIFEIGKDAPDAIQKEMQKYKKDFDLAGFQVVAQ